MGEDNSKEISYDHPSYEIFPTNFAYPNSKELEDKLLCRGVKFQKIYNISKHYDKTTDKAYPDSSNIKMCTVKLPPKWGLLMTCRVIQKKKLSYNEETRGYILDDTGTAIAYVFYHVIGNSYKYHRGLAYDYDTIIVEYERNIIECGMEPVEEKKIDSELTYFSKGLIIRIDHEFKSIIDKYKKLQHDGADQYVLDKEYEYIISYYDYYIKSKSKYAIKKLGYVNYPTRLISTFDNIWLNVKDSAIITDLPTKSIAPSAPSSKDLKTTC